MYYQRNPQKFLHNLPQHKQEELLETLSSEYRNIILGYFSKHSPTNQFIEQFVNQAF
ncbi:MAG: hypothetical protein BRC34_12055 [Cyanobacteria bacterium QH_1_48_107]|nr:MAG: hypothetical protein BRC34_12055 [Cyanobacteria bacterium QH_1_48_107]